MTPYFHSFAQFIAMGGHGGYVWASWLITAIGIIALIVMSRTQRNATYRNIVTQQARQHQRQNRYSSKL